MRLCLLPMYARITKSTKKRVSRRTGLGDYRPTLTWSAGLRYVFSYLQPEHALTCCFLTNSTPETGLNKLINCWIPFSFYFFMLYIFYLFYTPWATPIQLCMFQLPSITIAHLLPTTKPNFFLMEHQFCLFKKPPHLSLLFYHPQNPNPRSSFHSTMKGDEAFRLIHLSLLKNETPIRICDRKL